MTDQLFKLYIKQKCRTFTHFTFCNMKILCFSALYDYKMKIFWAVGQNNVSLLFYILYIEWLTKNNFKSPFTSSIYRQYTNM